MIFIMLGLLGLCLGSFVNAFVWRFHEQKKVKTPKQRERLSITRGRSMCPNCKHILATKDLIPVLSWLELRGRCRYCHNPISWQYPLVELITALLFMLSYVTWPYGFGLLGTTQFSLWLVILVIFMILIVYDIKWMLLPNKIVYPLIGVTIVSLLLQLILGGEIALLYQAIWGVLCVAGLFYAIFQVSSGKWIGGGDVKLAIALGIVTGGPIKAFLLLFIASLLGVLVSMPALIKGKKNYTSRIPFGPFLIVATIIVYLVGNKLIALYTKYILLI